jgi:hypothetical protein
MGPTGILVLVFVLVLAAVLVGFAMRTPAPQKGGQMLGGGEADGDGDPAEGCGCPQSIVAYVVDKKTMAPGPY